MSALFWTAGDSGRIEPGRTKVGASFSATFFLFTLTPLPWITKECCPCAETHCERRAVSGLYGGPGRHEIGLKREER